MSAIAVLGIGAITPLGASADANFDAILEQRCGLLELTKFDLCGLSTKTAGCVSGTFTCEELAIAAAKEALGPLDTSHIVVISASNFADTAEDSTREHIDVARAVKRALNLNGATFAVSLSCASGAAAIADAAELIQSGKAEKVLVVGVDILSITSWSGLTSLRTMSRTGEVMPFDEGRGGTIFSEGAAAILLSRDDGPLPLAYLAGSATGNNGFHLTAPPERASGSRAVMEQALKMGHVSPSTLGFVLAHATGTKANDQTEAEAIADILGCDSPFIPVTGLKGASGHLLGAAGVFEAAMAVLAIRRGIIPPLIRAPKTDEKMPILDFVGAGARKCEVRSVLTNSAGFGGCNASLLFVRDKKRDFSKAKSLSVAIRSIGFLSPLGLDAIDAEASLEEGGEYTFASARFSKDGREYEVGEVPAFDEYGSLPSPKAYVDREVMLALLAAKQALFTHSPSENMGVAVGSALGAQGTLDAFRRECSLKGPRLVRPMLFPHTYANAAASIIAMEWGLKGRHINYAGGDCAAGIALLEATLAIARGDILNMLAGGAEALTASRVSTEVRPAEGAAFFLLSAGNYDDAIAYIRGVGIGTTEDEALSLAGAQDSIYTLGDRAGSFRGAKTAIDLAAGLCDKNIGNFTVLSFDKLSATYVALTIEKVANK